MDSFKCLLKKGLQIFFFKILLMLFIGEPPSQGTPYMQRNMFLQRILRFVSFLPTSLSNGIRKFYTVNSVKKAFVLSIPV